MMNLVSMTFKERVTMYMRFKKIDLAKMLVLRDGSHTHTDSTELATQAPGGIQIGPTFNQSLLELR